MRANAYLPIVSEEEKQKVYISVNAERADGNIHIAVTGPGFTFSFLTPVLPVQQFADQVKTVCGETTEPSPPTS